MLGLVGAGAIVLCVVAALVTLLLAPQIEFLAGNARWSGAPWLAGAGVITLVVAAITVRPSAEHPARSAIVYAENADSSDAWLGSLGGTTAPWTREAIGAATLGPAWTGGLLETGGRFFGRQVDRVPLGAPNARILHDTTSGPTRTILLHISAPAGTTGLVMHARGAKVWTASIDGRLVDTSRYRRQTPEWIMQYWAIPDSGAAVELTIPAGGHLEFDLAARSPGLPSALDSRIPARPAYVVPSQTGDVSVVYRQWRF
jgi:hypothetical protein